MAFTILLDFMSELDYNYQYTFTRFDVPEPSRIKNKRANIFTKVKWFVLILVWKFNNRKWTKCRHKTKALDKYKYKLMKGYDI